MRPDRLRKLLRHTNRPNIDCTVPVVDDNALHGLIRHYRQEPDQLENIRVLLESGINYKHINRRGETALQLAQASGFHDIINLIKEKERADQWRCIVS